jgi:GTPase SAR1 family protein
MTGAVTCADGASRSPDLAAITQRLTTLLATAGLDELRNAAATEALRLSSSACALTVVGEFKRGKSTLINALLGMDVLPVAALPLTAVGTRVEFGESVHAVVEFRDGHRVEIEPSAIADYATERGNPGNQRGVAGVVATVPVPWLRAPLRLIDTPGIGSVFADVSATAGALLADADAAMVVLSAEQPASRRELDFLEEVLASGVHAFVVENKMDLVPLSERHEVLEFLHQQLGARDAAMVQVFALSSDQARCAQRAGDTPALAASGLPALQAALVKFAQCHGADAVARGVRRRLVRIIERALSRLQLRERSGPLSREWHDQRRAQLEQRVNVELFRDLLDARHRVAVYAEELICRVCVEAPEGALVHRLESAFDQSPVWQPSQPVRRWATEVETRARSAFDSVINQWSTAERDVVTAFAREQTTPWSQRAVAILEPIIGRLPALIPPAIEASPPAIELPALQLTRAPLLPGGLGRRQVRRRLWRWLRVNLPAVLKARRAASDANLTAAVRHAEEQFHRQLSALAAQAIASLTAEPAPLVAAQDTPLAELRRLRAALLEDVNGD